VSEVVLVRLRYKKVLLNCLAAVAYTAYPTKFYAQPRQQYFRKCFI